ncbi:hypothetical protein SISNIDRAFT_491901 [Sistotremastrum niveocremeum HHB9708]|uniref:Uncharacterized protein n=1 Tax=Sistotremastrum niveocremeum HHB9708 TaxID=1314777 RepID=A0A164M9K1_9AGAM|nr:hypothetical protein SISNIDRAFT_491901 [Sistotremastrum niveocremeum HHB9708]
MASEPRSLSVHPLSRIPSSVAPLIALPSLLFSIPSLYLKSLLLTPSTTAPFVPRRSIHRLLPIQGSLYPTPQSSLPTPSKNALSLLSISVYTQLSSIDCQYHDSPMPRRSPRLHLFQSETWQLEPLLTTKLFDVLASNPDFAYYTFITGHAEYSRTRMRYLPEITHEIFHDHDKFGSYYTRFPEAVRGLTRRRILQLRDKYLRFREYPRRPPVGPRSSVWSELELTWSHRMDQVWGEFYLETDPSDD